MSEDVYGGYRWKRQTEEHLQDPMFLKRYGYIVYFQNDEDGILQEIFGRTEDKQAIMVTVTNSGSEILSSSRRYPINLSYHILDQNGSLIFFDGG